MTKIALAQNALNDWPHGKQWVLFPRTFNVPQGKPQTQT